MTRLVALVALALVVAACGGPVLANPPAPHPFVTLAPSATPRPADPVAVELPRDDAPHDRLTEWWYYTGHLADETGGRWGFEFVVFRAERGGFPVSWASHLALTDESGGRFSYAQRSEIGPQVDRSTGAGFALSIGGGDPAAGGVPVGAPWTMAGSDGRDRLQAVAAGSEVAGDRASTLAIDLRLAARKAAVVHDGDGWIDFGPAGGSYYYSRTDMAADGTITLGDRALRVSGTAWFDHQWGDFISVGAGGWDWFAVNLDDGTDLALSLIRAADGSYPLAYGTLVDPDGRARHLDREAFEVEATGTWTSSATDARYPAGWRVTLPGEGLEVTLAPTVAHQELDTRATTGVVYWEGSQVVTATRRGARLGGEAYVELTGYDPGRQAWRQRGGVSRGGARGRRSRAT